MTFIWFIVWLIANNVGGPEPLLFNPVNPWAGTLLLAVALDLSRQHVSERRRRPDRQQAAAREPGAQPT